MVGCAPFTLGDLAELRHRITVLVEPLSLEVKEAASFIILREDMPALVLARQQALPEHGVRENPNAVLAAPCPQDQV